MKKNISLSFDEELLNKIEKICNVSERTKSWFVKTAVENYIEDIEDLEIALERSQNPISDFVDKKELKKMLEEER
jgi:RHH-type transcriptional regulator, rel operon repressor / antitoxin RelB